MNCEICGARIEHAWTSCECGVPVVACSQCALEWTKISQAELLNLLAVLKDKHSDEREDTDPHTTICELAATLKAAEDERDRLTRWKSQAVANYADLLGERDKLQNGLDELRKQVQSAGIPHDYNLIHQQLAEANRRCDDYIAGNSILKRDIAKAEAERDEAIARREETVAMLKQVEDQLACLREGTLERVKAKRDEAIARGQALAEAVEKLCGHSHFGEDLRTHLRAALKSFRGTP